MRVSRERRRGSGGTQLFWNCGDVLRRSFMNGAELTEIEMAGGARWLTDFLNAVNDKIFSFHKNYDQ